MKRNPCDCYVHLSIKSEMQRVLVTGFKPFGGHKVNASWEAVKRLPGIWRAAASLEVAEWPVEYSGVPQVDADLVIHTGLSAKAENVVLECVARNGPYVKPDEAGCLPDNNECCVRGQEQLETLFDVTRLCEASGALSSNDAGLFLCEFVYYRALQSTSRSALFVHLPPEEILPADAAAAVLCKIAESCLEQLEAKSDVM